MTKIGNIISESVKNDLGFEEKRAPESWEISKRLFDNLKKEIIIRNYHSEFKKDGRLKCIHFELIEGGQSYGVFKASPVVKNNKMYLAFRKPRKLFIDAANVFGESIHKID